LTHKSDSGRTNVYSVLSTHGLPPPTLGFISWHAPWRRYVFAPWSQTVYDVACLKEITEFIENAMAERQK